MISFLGSILLLIVGYFTYGLLVERVFGMDSSRPTPAIRLRDDVDYVPLPIYKTFLIEFLNIAGLGPIFGAVAGALWGPSAFLWIVFGNILGGAVHDYLSGMISVRMDGASLPNIVGKTLGKALQQFMLFFTVVLMILVGAVFMLGPAEILASIFHANIHVGGVNIPINTTFWAIVIFIYYFLATLLPIDKIIGRIYPIFGFLLFFMAISIFIAMIVKGYKVPEVWGNLYNHHYLGDKMPIFPLMFISIACGAVSGFHATQSPMMARCITNEKQGRFVFYGAMVMEGIVALIWAAIAMAFFGSIEGLNEVMGKEGRTAAYVVNLISNTLLGRLGAILALLGVVAAPITSGDTAFRSARLIIADAFSISQTKIKNRLLIAVFLFVGSFFLTQINYNILWRYMAWSNQTLATITLWAVTVYLFRENKFYWISLLPAAFMTMVTSTYFFFAPETLSLPYNLSLVLGVSVTLFILGLFFIYVRKNSTKKLLIIKK